MAYQQTARRARGTIVVYMMALLAVLTVSVVMTSVNLAAIHTRMGSLQFKRDQAFYAAEAGIQRALYEREYGDWIASINNTAGLYDTTSQWSYQVTPVMPAGMTSIPWNFPVRIRATGRLVSDASITCTVMVDLSPRQVVPAINLGSGLHEAGNITVDGNVLLKGNLDLDGKVAVNGSIIYGGTNTSKANATYSWQDPNTIPAPPAVWYDATGTQTPPGNVVNVTPMVQPSNGAKKLNSATPDTLDFRNASNGVLYYFGDITLRKIDVYGSGTLVVFGSVTIQNGGFGTTSEPVNIVATGTIATQADFRIYGSVYTNGDITHQGQFDVTGTINAQGSMYPTNSNSGAGGATITRAPPPAFDPRPTIGTNSTLVQNFTGPTF